MSYILNALRKSEQERQAVAPDSVTSRILIQQAQHAPKKSGKFIIALVISNLLLVVYFIGLTQKTPSAVKPGVLPSTPQAGLMAKPDAQANAIDTVIEHPHVTPPVAETKSPAIADIVAIQKVAAQKLPVKPVTTQAPSPAEASPPKPPVTTETKPVTVANKQPIVLPVTNAIPYLDELPSEFRRNVPKLSINVFVYVKEPAERFVMIDMVKYKTGQQIKDALELKEIRPDSLVVVYNQRTFQIRRP